MGSTGRDQVTAAGRRAERLAFPVGLVLTVAILIAAFYYPIGRVLADAVVRGGQLTVGPLVELLADPFYTGDLAGAVRDPLGAPGDVLAWLRAGAPAPRIGLLGFTAYQAALSTIASVLLGLPGAYLLARYEFRGRETLRSLTMLPFVLPSILVAVGFLAMFGRRGVLNDVLSALGLGPVTLLFTLEIIILAHALYNAPLVIRIVGAAWETVDRQRVETARSLGASPLAAFRDVVLPTLWPALLTASLLAFLFSFMSFPIVLALGGLRLATIEVWLFARVRDLQLAEAATIATIETALTLGLTYLYLRYEARQAAAHTGGTARPRRRLLAGRRTLRDPHRIGLVAYGVIGLVVFVGPLLSLLIESVTTPDGQFTTAYYQFLLDQQIAEAAGTVRPLPAVANSLLFGVGTLLLAVPMGLVVSLVAIRGGRGSRLAEALLSAPLAVSGIVVGLGLLQTFVFGATVFGHRLVVTGPVAIVAAHAVAAYPFVSRNITPALGDLDPRVTEAARSLGATPVRALLDIELPLIAGAVMAGTAFAFAISLGEFDSTVLLAEGVDAATMPVALERYIGNRSIGPSLGPATAMGSVLLAVTAVSFILIDRLGGRWTA